jgi:phosphopantothenoylcysteine decarboxylase/phosphopantothenate--cysteine ligase
MFKNKKILLGITGSIAATKCIDLVQQLLSKKVQLKIVLTSAAEYFVSMESLKKALGTEDVYKASDLFNSEDEMLHIELARFPDVILIAPASANFIAKLASGFADDLLSSICVASGSEIAISPAMNQQMWHNLFTQENIQKLKNNDVKIIGPTEGLQACGDYGYGRMLEPVKIVEDLEQLFAYRKLLVGKKILITAGPTIEQIDAVRYISNFSSGKMGYAIAQSAQKMGAEVVLISGPTNLTKPAGIKTENINSANDMLNKVFEHIAQADIFIACAAVADYTPIVTHQNKIKKQQNNLQLELKPTVDIVKEVAKMKDKIFVVGFAAETDDVLGYAQKKLSDKNLDMIVVNDVSDGAVFGRDVNQVSILTKHSQQFTHTSPQSKKNIADIILQRIAQEINN